MSLRKGARERDPHRDGALDILVQGFLIVIPRKEMLDQGKPREKATP